MSSKFKIIHFNRLNCELGRYDVVDDDCGAPLMLATVAQNYELRQALEYLAEGDRLELVVLEPPATSAEPAAAEPVPFGPGAILYASWGYEQTNVDFYRIVSRDASTDFDWLTLEKVEKVETSDDTEDRPATMTGRVVPADPIKPIEGEKPIRRKLRPNGSEPFVKINSYTFAYLWDGTPKRVSHYG